MSISETLGETKLRSGTTAREMASSACEMVDLLAVPEPAWADLVTRAAEPNAFFQPAWARAVARHAEGRSGARALLAWDGPARSRLIGLLPVVPAGRALKLPLPVLVAWEAYAPLTVPLIDRERIEAGAQGLLKAAAGAGALALLLPSLTDDGPAVSALRRAAGAARPQPVAFNRHARARLDARQDGDGAVGALGAKKLKELRRQRNRLGDRGEVSFGVARAPGPIAAALDRFLALEAAGWKGARGTALARKDGDAAFIREAVGGLAASNQVAVATLSAGDAVVAAGVLLRHLRRGYFFKIAYDETAARTSPGVQLTLDVTRELCADAAIDDVDSIAIAEHPMIDHVWRTRLPVCDLLLPVRCNRLSFALIAGAIAARYIVRGHARRAVHAIRMMRGKHP